MLTRSPIVNVNYRDPISWGDTDLLSWEHHFEAKIAMRRLDWWNAAKAYFESLGVKLRIMRSSPVSVIEMKNGLLRMSILP